MSDTDFDFDELLDTSIEDLADLPGFTPFPKGSHRVILSFEKKVVNDEPSIEMKMKAVETVELANDADTPLQPGDETGILFMLGNEIGQGKLKSALRPLAEATGQTSLKGITEASEGMEVVVTTKIRKNKNTDAEYTDLVSLVVE